MSRKRVTLNIKTEVWDEFINKLEIETGSSGGKGHISPTIESLIINYFLSYVNSSDNSELVSSLESENKKLLQDIENLKNDSISKDTILQFEEKIRELEITNSKISKEYSNFKEEHEVQVKKLQSSIDDEKLKLETLQSQYDNDIKEVESLKNMNSSLEEKTQSQKKKLSDLDSLSKELNALEEENKSLLIDKERLTNERDNLSTKVTYLEENEKRLNRTIDKQEEIIESKSSDANRVREDYKNIQEELSLKRKEYTRVSNERNHSEERSRQLQEEVNQLEIKENNYRSVLRQLDNMGLMDRLLGRYPEDIKELKG